MTATLKMIAEEAGVSIRTVGRSLRGDNAVTPEVAERVLKIARERGYVPNAAARSLRTNSSSIVGIIVRKQDPFEVSRRCIDCMEKHLGKHNLHPLLSSLPENFEALMKLLQEWTGLVRTVIFAEWDSAWQAGKLLHLPMQFIFFDRIPLNPESFNIFSIDRSSGVSAAVKALAAAGCRRIAQAGAAGTSSRREGFEKAVEVLAPDIRFFRLECAGPDMADGYGLGPEIIRRKIDGVFFDTDRMALGFYRYASERGIRIPEDIAVAGFDNDTACIYAIPALSSVAHPHEELVQAVVRRILEPGGMVVHQSFRSCFIARESIKRP